MTPLEQINHRERQILVTSYLYYQLDKNIITDDKFDEYAFDLVELIKKYPEEFKQSGFHDAFTEFDGSSGFDLPYLDPRIEKIGRWFASRMKEK